MQQGSKLSGNTEQFAALLQVVMLIISGRECESRKKSIAASLGFGGYSFDVNGWGCEMFRRGV